MRFINRSTSRPETDATRPARPVSGGGSSSGSEKKSDSPVKREGGRPVIRRVVRKSPTPQNTGTGKIYAGAVSAENLDRRPTPKFLNREKKVETVIVPYASFEPFNGVYREDAIQRMSNIRFTHHDRVMARQAGLSW